MAGLHNDRFDWARTAGDSSWDTEISTDRAMAVEGEIVRAKSAMKNDSKILLRKVSASRIPELCNSRRHIGSVVKTLRTMGSRTRNVSTKGGSCVSQPSTAKSSLILRTRPIMVLPRIRVVSASTVALRTKPFITWGRPPTQGTPA